MATAAAAGYNFLQLLRCIYNSFQKENSCRSNRAYAWFCFVLDQVCFIALFEARTDTLFGFCTNEEIT